MNIKTAKNSKNTKVPLFLRDQIGRKRGFLRQSGSRSL